MSLNAAPTGAYASPAGEQHDQEKDIPTLKAQIEEVAMRASGPLNAIHTELPKLSAIERSEMRSKYPEIFELEATGNRETQTAVQYLFNRSIAGIERSNGTQEQKRKRYQELRDHFEKIAQETASAYAEIIGHP